MSPFCGIHIPYFGFFFGLAGIILEILSRNFTLVANFHTQNESPILQLLVKKI